MKHEKENINMKELAEGIIKETNYDIRTYRKGQRFALLFLSIPGIVITLILAFISWLIRGRVNFLGCLYWPTVLCGGGCILLGIAEWYHPATSDKFGWTLAIWFSSVAVYDKTNIFYALIFLVLAFSLFATICKLSAYKKACGIEYTQDANMIRNYEKKRNDALTPYAIFASIYIICIIYKIFFT